MIRILADVNVLVSAVLGPVGFSRKTIAEWERERITLITAEGILSELDDKLRLPRIHRRLPDPDANRKWILHLLRTQAQMINVPLQECLPITGDPEDDYVLAATRLSKADYLVTGDQGLIELREYSGSRIVSPRELVLILKSQSA